MWFCWQNQKATWVEAIEKKEDSNNYLKCLLSSPTKQDSDGYISLNPLTGFGIVVSMAQVGVTSIRD
jgi:hypothetical protein